MIEINESMKFAKFIFQKRPGTGSFYGLYVKSSSHYSLVHRLPASSSKSAPTLTVFFTFSSANRPLATDLCTFCRQLLQIEAGNRGNRDPILRRPRKPLYTKKQGFAPGNLFKPEFTRSRLVALPNYLMMMMMMWLT